MHTWVVLQHQYMYLKLKDVQQFRLLLWNVDIMLALIWYVWQCVTWALFQLHKMSWWMSTHSPALRCTTPWAPFTRVPYNMANRYLDRVMVGMGGILKFMMWSQSPSRPHPPAIPLILLGENPAMIWSGLALCIGLIAHSVLEKT